LLIGLPWASAEANPGRLKYFYSYAAMLNRPDWQAIKKAALSRLQEGTSD